MGFSLESYDQNRFVESYDQNRSVWVYDTGPFVSRRPDIANIAFILTFNSIIGKVAKIALHAAIDDVNVDPTILSGTKLKITFHDSNYSAFMSMMEELNTTGSLDGHQRFVVNGKLAPKTIEGIMK
ncbi:glutamate receptor 3.6-like protein [Tanacetum coccineum]